MILPKEKFRFRPSVYGIIRNGDKICICTNKGNGKYWFPGGGINVCELRKDALLREIDEETGLKNVQIGPLVGSHENFYYYEPTDEASHYYLFFYECQTNEVTLKTNEEIDDDEVINVKWVSISELKKDDFSGLNDEIFGMIQALK